MINRFGFFLIAVLLVCLPGCGTTWASPGAIGDGGTVFVAEGGGVAIDKVREEIVVVSPFGPEDENRENYVNAYSAFEAGTGIAVKDEAFTTTWELLERVYSDFESGNDPDVLFFFTGAEADELVENGKVVSLGDIRRVFPEYASNMKDAMMPVSTSNGWQYAVPVNGYWVGLFVNLGLLAACGVEAPGRDYTWDRFLGDCETIRGNGYIPVACSLNEAPQDWFEFCTFNYGNIANHCMLPKDAGDDVGKRWVSGLTDIKEMYQRGYFPENTLEATAAETDLLMIENRAVFLLDGSWKVSWFEENALNPEDFAVAYVPAKGERKATDIIGGLSQGYYISKKAWDDFEKRAACVEFIQAMTTDEVVSSFGELSVTALKNAAGPPKNADPLTVSAYEMTKNCTGAVSAVQDLLTPKARDMLFYDVRNMVTGLVTPEKAIEECLSLTD